MLQIRDELKDALQGNVSKIVISSRVSEDDTYKRADILPTVVKGNACYQISCYTEKQVFQNNVRADGLLAAVEEYFPTRFSQIHIFADGRDISMRVSKKGKLLKNVTKQIYAATRQPQDGHNRKKHYIIEEGTVIPPLVDMGIFTKDGKVVHAMYDKYRQINRFLEMVDDVLKNEQKQTVHIIDFGCGKSYLTFVLYYYFTEVRHKQVRMTGLDLKADVIEKCNAAAAKYGYNGLHFEMGDIQGYHTDIPVDMVVSLHACDVATDYALYNAVVWNAKYILSVPYCQHEVNGQLQSEVLLPLTRHGILKERFSALATDAIRGNMLEYCGYRTQIMEFVDMAHSPKNLLIRAVKSGIGKEKRERALEEAKQLCTSLSIEPTIYKLLGEGKEKET